MKKLFLTIIVIFFCTSISSQIIDDVYYIPSNKIVVKTEIEIEPKDTIIEYDYDLYFDDYVDYTYAMRLKRFHNQSLVIVTPFYYPTYYYWNTLDYWFYHNYVYYNSWHYGYWGYHNHPYYHSHSWHYPYYHENSRRKYGVPGRTVTVRSNNRTSQPQHSRSGYNQQRSQAHSNSAVNTRISRATGTSSRPASAQRQNTVLRQNQQSQTRTPIPSRRSTSPSYSGQFSRSSSVP